MNRIFTLAILLSVCIPIFAKEIYGKVLDDKDEPVTGATVALVQLPDTVMVDAKILNRDGSFHFVADADKKYLLSITSIGFEDRTVAAEFGVNIIHLETESQELQELVVEAKSPYTYAKGNKLVFAPNELKKQVPDVYGLIKFAPLVTQREDNLTILDRPVTIYLNGKNPPEGQEYAKQLLKNIPSQYVKSIEVMPSSGASVSASTASAIINVVMIDPNQGWFGYVNPTLSYTNKSFNEAINAMVSYSTSRFKITLYGGGFFDQSKSHSESSRYVFDNNELSESDSRDTSHTETERFRVSMQYYPSSRIEIGLTMETAMSGFNSTNRETQKITDTFGSNSYITDYRGRQPHQSNGLSGVAWYNLQTDKRGSMFEAQIDVLNYNNSNNFDGIVANEPYTLSKANSNTSFVGKLNQRQKLGDKWGQLWFGYEFNSNHTNNNRIQVNEQSHLIYDEAINSAFAEYSGGWNAFSLVAGLRMEHTGIKIDNKTSGDKADNNYLNLLPSVSMSLRLPKQQYLMLQFYEIMMRPQFAQLNPLKVWTSANTYVVGNPYLKPTRYYTASLIYRMPLGFSLACNYNVNPNGIIQRNTYLDQDGNFATSCATNGHSSGVMINLSWSKYLLNKVFVNLQNVVRYNNIKGEMNGFWNRCDYWGYDFSVYASYAIYPLYHWTLDVNYSIGSPTKGLDSDNYKWENYLYLSLSKTFDFGGSFSIYGGNLIPQKQTSYFANDLFRSYSRTFGYCGTFGASFTYRFGNQKLREAQSRAASVSDRAK